MSAIRVATNALIAAGKIKEGQQLFYSNHFEIQILDEQSTKEIKPLNSLIDLDGFIRRLYRYLADQGITDLTTSIDKTIPVEENP